ncbi:MAG: alpha/beta hydrolase [Rhodospirillaceae bacterium]
MWVPLFRELAGMRSLLRYDSRGVGMSNWDVPEITYDSFLTDIETVIAAAEREPFALLGISQGAAIAIDYAARHPERVSHLILWGGFARGRRQRGNPENLAESEAFITLMQQGWGRENSPFRDMFASLYLPDATDEQIGWWSRMQRTATSAENAVRMREAIDNIDVSASLPHITVPTLIMHSQGDLVAPVSEARYMAARIPDAQFVLFESTNLIVMSQEAAWQRAVHELRAFLADG